MSCDKQHTKPCSGCPFRKSVTPGELGGSHPLTYVGQAQGPFWLPCHERYIGENRLNPENAQCAGAAIFRSNIGASARLPAQLMSLPADTSEVFGSHAEFLAHHAGVSLEKAEALLREMKPEELVTAELRRAFLERGKAAVMQIAKKVGGAT